MKILRFVITLSAVWFIAAAGDAPAFDTVSDTQSGPGYMQHAFDETSRTLRPQEASQPLWDGEGENTAEENDDALKITQGKDHTSPAGNKAPARPGGFRIRIN